MRLRCEDHGQPDPSQSTYTYVASVKPYNYPDTAAICGRNGCDDPGIAYLNDREYWHYQHEGKRDYRPSNEAYLKIRLTDEVVNEREQIVRSDNKGPDDKGNWPEYPEQNSAADW